MKLRFSKNCVRSKLDKMMNQYIKNRSTDSLINRSKFRSTNKKFKSIYQNLGQNKI